MKLILAILAIACASCASTPTLISGASPGEAIKITNNAVITDLKSAAYNFDNAVLVGALPATDPGPACIHGALVKAGIEVPAGTTAPASFVPKNDGVASLGVIAYIIVQQQQAIIASGAFKVDPTCEALIGRIVIDGIKQVNNAVPLIPGIPRIP